MVMQNAQIASKIVDDVKHSWHETMSQQNSCMSPYQAQQLFTKRMIAPAKINVKNPAKRKQLSEKAAQDRKIPFSRYNYSPFKLSPVHKASEKVF